MSLEMNKIIARRVIADIFNQEDLNQIENLFSLEAVIHDPDQEYRGMEQVRKGIAGLHSAFPDLRFTIEDLLAEGDKVAVYYRGQGTHQGAFRGVLPTGKRIDYTGIVIWRIEDGKVAEQWTGANSLRLFQQLGSFPPSG